jgi:hypothetical protein
VTGSWEPRSAAQIWVARAAYTRNPQCRGGQCRAGPPEKPPDRRTFAIIVNDRAVGHELRFDARYAPSPPRAPVDPSDGGARRLARAAVGRRRPLVTLRHIGRYNVPGGGARSAAGGRSVVSPWQADCTVSRVRRGPHVDESGGAVAVAAVARVVGERARPVRGEIVRDRRRARALRRRRAGLLQTPPKID